MSLVSGGEERLHSPLGVSNEQESFSELGWEIRWEPQ